MIFEARAGTGTGNTHTHTHTHTHTPKGWSVFCRHHWAHGEQPTIGTNVKNVGDYPVRTQNLESSRQDEIALILGYYDG